MSHAFEVKARWQEGLRGEVLPAGVAHAVPFAVPKEFGGPGGEWTPEHLLAASVGACVMATFLTIAQMSKLAVKGYESKATAAMEKTPEGFRITGLTLATRITVASDKDRERAQRMIEKAEKMCPISNSLKPGVALEATIEVAP